MVSIGPRTDLPSVLDANRDQVGTVIGSELSDGTREPTALLVSLDPDLQTNLEADEANLWLPFETVRSIRRGEVELSEGIHQLLDGAPEAAPLGVEDLSPVVNPE